MATDSRRHDGTTARRHDGFDAIVLGSGINELVTAVSLARAGRSVLVLEDREELGGATVTEELEPGFKVDTALHDAGWLPSWISGELGLERDGLEPLRPEATCFAPGPDGQALVLWRDQAKTVESIGRLSPADAREWPAFAARMSSLAGFLEHAYSAPPPRPVSTQPADLFAMLGLGRKLRGLGRAGMVELLRTLPMPVADLLDEWFENDLLKGALGASGITHLFQGPRSAGTAFVMLHHHVGSPEGCFRGRTTVRGGIGALVRVLVAAAGRSGVVVRTSAPVERILVRDGRTAGVVLADGEEIAAKSVASGADPRRTFLELVDAAECEPEFLRAVKHLKFRGVWAKVNLSLDGLPSFTALPGAGPHLGGVISISPSLNYLERAFDDAKHGRVAQRPYLEAVIPTVADPSLAPQGKHVMSVAMQFAPYRLKDGTWNAAGRQSLGDAVVNLLAEYAPDLPGLIRKRQVLTPADLESRFGLAEGNLYQGELTLDQVLFMRPLPGWAHYTTPVEGLHLCGAAAHPGGGIAGAAGALAAKAMLKKGER